MREFGHVRKMLLNKSLSSEVTEQEQRTCIAGATNYEGGLEDGCEREK